MGASDKEELSYNEFFALFENSEEGKQLITTLTEFRKTSGTGEFRIQYKEFEKWEQ
jgi:hypothetical protein